MAKHHICKPQAASEFIQFCRKTQSEREFCGYNDVRDRKHGPSLYKAAQQAGLYEKVPYHGGIGYRYKFKTDIDPDKAAAAVWSNYVNNLSPSTVDYMKDQVRAKAAKTAKTDSSMTSTEWAEMRYSFNEMLRQVSRLSTEVARLRQAMEPKIERSNGRNHVPVGASRD